MTDATRLDAALSRWFNEEATVRAPERLVHETRARIAATPQRRVVRGPIAAPGFLTLGRLVTAAVIGALVIAVASLSIYLPTTGPARSPSPSPPATATPSPIPTLSVLQPYECERSRGTCLGPLAAGVYETTTFQPKIRFSVPEGWSNLYDVPGQFDLTYDSGGRYTYPDGITFSDRLSMYANPVAASATDGAPLVGIGKSAAELAAWLVSRQGLVATQPKAVSIGGATGFMLVVSSSTGARSAPDRCTAEHGEPRCASLFVAADPQADFGFGLVGPESVVVYLLDTPSGDTLLLAIDDVDGVDAAGLVNAATPIVESIGGFK